jgi:DNA-binding MarR family transcriptional regulator
VTNDPAPRAVPGGPPQRLRRLPSWLINQLAVVSNRHVAARLGRPGVRTEYGVLATLTEFGSLSQAQIGRRMGIDRSDMVALINRLEGQELVVRERDPSDRRRNTIRLTTAGKRRLHAIDTQVDLAQNDLLEPLNVAERETLTTLLQRLVEHHHNSAQSQADPQRPRQPEQQLGARYGP